MVAFGLRLRESCIKEWEGAYVDYAALKDSLRPVRDAAAELPATAQGSVGLPLGAVIDEYVLASWTAEYVNALDALLVGSRIWVACFPTVLFAAMLDSVPA